MSWQLNGRKVVDIELDCVSKDLVDYFVSSAYFDDTGEALSYDELEELKKQNMDELTTMALEQGAMH